MIRIDALWLCTQPQDMRCGADRLLAVVVNTVGCAQAHHGWLFANARATRIKLLVHDGFGVWLAARSLNQGKFVWGHAGPDGRQLLSAEQLQALVIGLPWQRLGEAGVITVL